MIKISSIINFSKNLVFVDSSASIEEVYTKMISEGVSYLPIIDRKVKNIGVYKRKKIFKWLINNPKKDISKEPLEIFKYPALPEVQLQTLLKDALKLLKNNSAILIKDSGEYKFLISPRVISNFLEKYASRFMVFEELEEILRYRITEKKIDLSSIISESLDKPLPSDPELLDFGQYRIVLSKKWKELGYNHHFQTLMDLINSALEYRNQLMHFRLDDNELNTGLEDAKKLLELLKSS